MKREMPRMLSIVIEPRKSPARTRKTRSRRAWSAEASMGWSPSMAGHDIAVPWIRPMPGFAASRVLKNPDRARCGHSARGQGAEAPP